MSDARKSKDLKPGDVVHWRGRSEFRTSGCHSCVVLKERKADDSGWWLEDNRGGLSDSAIDDPQSRWWAS